MRQTLSATWRHPVVKDAVFVLGWFVVLGVLGAVVWWQVTPLAEFTRTASGAQMDEAELGRRVNVEGVFLVVGAVGGLVSGVALLALRRRDPVPTVLLVAAGACLAGWLMLRMGLWLGPGDPQEALKGVAVGDKVPIQLKPDAPGVFYVWPVAAMLGAVGVLWGTSDYRSPADHRPADGGAPGGGLGNSANDGFRVSESR